MECVVCGGVKVEPEQLPEAISGLCDRHKTSVYVDAMFADWETYCRKREKICRGDAVVHPFHYNRGIEVWDFTTSHQLGFLEGNVVKYVVRYKHKGGLEDLKKAKAYLTKLIDSIEDSAK